MKKELGIFVLLAVLVAFVAIRNPVFLLAINLENTAALIGMYGIFSIGLGLVIITGGIDLSVGSLFALQGVLLGMMLVDWGWNWALAAALLLVGTMALGLVNGLLITRARMQPFIVTLCGLLIYRGAARYVADDRSIGFGTESFGPLRFLQSGKLPAIPIAFIVLGVTVVVAVFAIAWFRRRRHGLPATPATPATPARGAKIAWLVVLGLLAIASIALVIGWFSIEPPRRINRSAPALQSIWTLLATGEFAAPMPFVLLIIVAVIVGIVLHGSVYGRYLYAVGRNEEATRFSGVNTKRVVAAAYVISAALAALSGLLFAFYANAITPATHGSFYELYGIAAAVLGGCSLRGGEGSVIGVVLGAALIQILQNVVNLLGIPSSLNFAVLGGVILFGVLGDQLVGGREGPGLLDLVKRLGGKRTPASSAAG